MSTPEFRLKSLTIELYNSIPNRKPTEIINDMISLLVDERSKHNPLTTAFIPEGVSGVVVTDDDGEIE